MARKMHGMSRWPPRVQGAVADALGDEAYVVRRLRPREVWIVRASDEPRLRAVALEDWFKLESIGGARLVKMGHDRSTWRVPLAPGAVYVKRYEPRGLRGWIKANLIGGPAEREWRSTVAAERAGVPAVRAIALLSRGPRPAGLLFLEEEPGAASLREFWEQVVQAAPRLQRRALACPVIEAAAALFATAHDRGFLHRDAHGGNVLVRRAEDGRWRALFSDLHGAELLEEAASASAAAENLAHLEPYFRHSATRCERLRFLVAYLARRERSGMPAARGTVPSRPRARQTLRGWVDAVTAASHRHREDLARQRDARLGRDAKYFAELSLGGGWRARVALTLGRRHLFAESDVPDRDVATWRALLTQLVLALGDGEERPSADGVVWESCGERPRLLGAVASPARRRFEASHRARHRDEAAPLVLGYLERRRGLMVDRCGVLLPAGGGSNPKG